MAFIVWTIGHSTRSTDELTAALGAHGIELVADVRRFPASRRWPQFNSATLEVSLAASAISYRWFPALGGRRPPLAESPNTGWRVAGFRGYADHMISEEFAEGLFELLMLARGLRTAVMCAELLWWRCHRRLIGDVLTLLGATVVHIQDATHAEPHRIASPARISDGLLEYSAQQVAEIRK